MTCAGPGDGHIASTGVVGAVVASYCGRNELFDERSD